MQFLSRLLVAAGLVSAVLAANAQEYRTSPEYRQCTNAVTPGEMEGDAFAACDVAELKRQDVKLNATYNRLKGMLTKEQVPILIKGQRAWLKQREDWCLFEKTLSGSSAAQNHSWCVLESTLRQIQTLELSIQRVE